MPSNEELTDFYSIHYASRTKANIYDHKNREDFLETNKSVIEDDLTLLSLIEPYRNPQQKRLLDVGCGHGFMCYAAKIRGLEATGVDLDPDAKRIGTEHLGVKIISGSISDVERNNFDIVTEIMTLEHMREPDRHVAKVRDRLCDDGLYAGSVPNIDGIGARLQGRNWYHLIPPEHLNYFNTKTLTRFLQRAGFDVLYTGTIPLYATPTVCFGVRSRLNRIIARQGNTVTKVLLIGFYRILTLLKRYMLYAPLNFLIVALRLPGNGIFWVARKRPTSAVSQTL